MTSLKSPIQPRLGMVFVPVSDMQRSRAWYGALLGCAPEAATHHGKICTFALEGGMALALDAHRPVRCSSQPLFFLWTDDILRSLRHVQALPATAVSDVEDVGSLSMFTFEDPDGNRLMVSQKNP